MADDTALGDVKKQNNQMGKKRTQTMATSIVTPHIMTMAVVGTMVPWMMTAQTPSMQTTLW